MKNFCLGIVLVGVSVFGSKVCSGQTFSEVTIGSFPGMYEGQIVWLDVDNDLDYDLIICGNLYTTLFKNSGGVFTESVGHNLPGLSRPAISMADFNHDGFVDLVLTGNSSGDSSPVPKSNVFINDGTGIFTASATANLLPLFFGSVDCGDFDLDGDVDILMTGYNKNDVAQSVIYSNNGDGSFSELSTTLLPGVFHGTGMWGDYDNDGDLDILLSGDNHTENTPNKPLTKIYRNKGDCTFEEVNTTITQVHGKSSWVDVNEDGRLDIFSSGYTSDGGFNSFLYLNQGTDSFVKSIGLPFEGTSFIDFRWADFDNDGDKDVLTSSAQGTSVSIFVNNGGTFTKLPGTNFLNAGVLSVDNFDSDQDQDIVLSGLDPITSLPVTKVYKNEINSVNDAPAIPTDLAALVLSGTETKLTWTASTDTETNSSTLGYAIRLGTGTGGSQIMSPLILSNGFIYGLDSSVPSTTNTIAIKNLLNGTYYCSVQALDQSRKASGSSSEVSFTVTASPATPLPPSNLTLTNLNTNYVKVTWNDQSFTEDNFELERSSTDESNYTTLTTLLKNVTTFVDKTVAYGQKYFYRVKAVNTNGSSPYATSASITSLAKGIFKKVDDIDLPADEPNFGVGASWVDYDNDGHEDIFITEAFNKNQLFKNNGNSTFTRILTGDLVLFAQQSRTATWGDYDNDGDQDVFIATSSLNHLFANNGDGTFTDITSSPFTDDSDDSNGAAWADYDNDGFLDLLVANYNAKNYLYHNNKNGTFTKILFGDLVNETGSFSNVSWCDFDGDGLQDALIVNYGGNLLLFKNKGNGAFEKVTNDPITNTSALAVGVSWADYDADGDFDVFIANNANQADLFFQNNGDGSFTRKENKITQSDVRASSSGWADFDNDGSIDLVLVTDNEKVLFRNNGLNDFEEITDEPSLSDHAYASGVAWGDYNRDGFLDLIVANAYAGNILLKNNGNSNHWISFKLIGTHTNKSAIGAKVRIQSGGKWQTDFVSSQTGTNSENSFPIEFGLGGSSNIDSVLIEWPQQGYQIVTNLAADQFVTMTEPSLFPNRPSLLSVVYAPTDKINVTWSDLASNETGYFIERSIAARSQFIKLSVTAANTTSYTDNILFDGDSVFYRISAVASGGRSWYSNILGTLVPIKGPTNLVAKITEDPFVKLEWLDNSSNESGYQIERSVDDNTHFTQIDSLNSNATSFEDHDFPHDKNLYYRVRAKTADAESEYSNEVTTLVTAVSSHETVTIFPNPAHDVIVLSNLNRRVDRVQIINLQGVEVATKSCVGLEEARISTKDLAAGFYFIKIEKVDGVIMSRVIIK